MKIAVKSKLGNAEVEKIEAMVIRYSPASPMYRLLVTLRIKSHKQPLSLLKRMQGVWFKYCEPCQYHRMGRCFGGENYLNRKVVAVASVSTPIAEYHGYHFPKVYECIAQLKGELAYNTEAEAFWSKEVVTLPRYAITLDPLETRLFWFLQDPDVNGKNVIPFAIGNVYGDGQVCLGSGKSLVNFSSFESAFNVLMNLRFNRDLAVFSRSLDQAEFVSLISTKGAYLFRDYLSEDKFFTDTIFDMVSDDDCDLVSQKEYEPFDGIVFLGEDHEIRVGKAS